MAQKSGPVALRFQHIDESDGLSNNNIRSIYKDNDGFLWFGTDDGLNRYDGSTFVQYRHDTKDSSSIAGDKVSFICDNRHGGLWVGSHCWGLTNFNKYSGKGYTFKKQFGNLKALQSDCDINVIYDEHGRTWVSSGGYLSLYNAETKTFEQHFSTEKNGHFTILGILYCNDNIWIGETKGLREYNTKTRKTTDYTNGLGYSGLCSPFEKTLTGDILLGTYDSGIFIFNPLTGRKIHLLHRNNIHKISFVTLGDRKQVWVATDKGLWIAALPEDIFQLSDASFTNYMPELMNTYAISSHVINTIFQDENGVIWLGTEAGINKLNPAYLRFQDVCIQNKKNKGLQARYDPQRAFIVKGDQGKIDYWFAFWNYGGLIKTDTNFEVQKQLQFKHESLPYPAIANVGNVFKGKDSNLWISTWDGLWSYDDKHDKLLNNYKLNSTDASQPEKSLFNFATHDKGGDIWIGTYNQGLYVLNPESNIWKVFKADSSEAGIDAIICTRIPKIEYGCLISLISTEIEGSS